MVREFASYLNKLAKIFLPYFIHRWNLLDFTTNTLYITTVVLKLISYMIVQNEIKNGNKAHAYSREKWDPWDPTLIR